MRHLVSLRSTHESDLFVIKWRITQMCDLRCSYCAQRKIRQEFTFARRAAETETLRNAAQDISALMDRLPEGTRVKLELVGGEVSLFDVEGLLSLVTSPRLVRVHMTTNFMRSADYYNSLALYLHARGVEFTLMCSFHYEFASMEKYISKALAVRENCNIFACEVVSNENNQELCAAFRARCEELGLEYSIDMDTRWEKASLRKEGKLLGCGRRVQKNPRYVAVLEEAGNRFERTYMTRNDFVTDGSIRENLRNKVLLTKGYICTHSWDYVYIEADKAVGRTTESKDCKNRMPIANFIPIPPCECQQNGCTLCGQMSLLGKEMI